MLNHLSFKAYLTTIKIPIKRTIKQNISKYLISNNVKYADSGKTWYSIKPNKNIKILPIIRIVPNIIIFYHHILDSLEFVIFIKTLKNSFYVPHALPIIKEHFSGFKHMIKLFPIICNILSAYKIVYGLTETIGGCLFKIRLFPKLFLIGTSLATFQNKTWGYYQHE